MTFNYNVDYEKDIIIDKQLEGYIIIIIINKNSKTTTTRRKLNDVKWGTSYVHLKIIRIERKIV